MKGDRAPIKDLYFFFCTFLLWFSQTGQSDSQLVETKKRTIRNKVWKHSDAWTSWQSSHTWVFVPRQELNCSWLTRCCCKTPKMQVHPLRCSPEQQVRGFAVCWLPVVQSAGRWLWERHCTFIFTASIHVCVRWQVVQGRPSACIRTCPWQAVGCLLAGWLLVHGSGWRTGWRWGAGCSRGSGWRLWAGRGWGLLGYGGLLWLYRGGRGRCVQKNVVHVVQFVHVWLWRFGWFVICTVEETDLAEGWLELVLYAADDLHKGWSHLRIVLPTHSHQLKPTPENTTHMRWTHKISITFTQIPTKPNSVGFTSPRNSRCISSKQAQLKSLSLACEPNINCL